jgi:hypothetical protein
MATHYWCSVEVQLNAGIVKPGTAIFARVSRQGNKPWQQWGSTKPATFIKDTQRVALPSLIYGTSVDPPELSVSVHIASLGGNAPVECWDVGEGSLEGPTSDKSNSCVLKRSGNVVGALYLTPITSTATSSSTIDKEFVVFNAIAVQLDSTSSTSSSQLKSTIITSTLHCWRTNSFPYHMPCFLDLFCRNGLRNRSQIGPLFYCLQ